MNSIHNATVIENIVLGVGTEKYSKDLIQSIHSLFTLIILFTEGCKTYKKTIAERQKSLSTPVKTGKLLRSRKQRVYIF